MLRVNKMIGSFASGSGDHQIRHSSKDEASASVSNLVGYRPRLASDVVDNLNHDFEKPVEIETVEEKNFPYNPRRQGVQA